MGKQASRQTDSQIWIDRCIDRHTHIITHLPSICFPMGALLAVDVSATLPSADGVDNADVANCGRPAADTYAAAKFGSVPISSC